MCSYFSATFSKMVAAAKLSLLCPGPWPDTRLLCQQYANQHVELVKTDLAHGIPVQHIEHTHDLSPLPVSHMMKEVIEQHICYGGDKDMDYSETAPKG